MLTQNAMTHEEMKYEVTRWSDGVLNMLAHEEDVSEELRELFLTELRNREGDEIVLTSQMLHEAGSSGYMGWTRKQLKVLGVSWPPPGGWLRRLVGTKVPLSKWNQFKSMKGKKK